MRRWKPFPHPQRCAFHARLSAGGPAIVSGSSQPFEVELLSILEDSAARALPTITAVAVDGAAPDLETRMSTKQQHQRLLFRNSALRIVCANARSLSPGRSGARRGGRGHSLGLGVPGRARESGV